MEGGDVDADLALVDDAAAVAVEVLDGVFDGDDVAAGGVVDVTRLWRRGWWTCRCR